MEHCKFKEGISLWKMAAGAQVPHVDVVVVWTWMLSAAKSTSANNNMKEQPMSSALVSNT
jgi:hypothetical protein